MKTAKIALAEEEEIRARQGNAMHDTTGPSGFVLLGFQIENMQCVIYSVFLPLQLIVR